MHACTTHACHKGWVMYVQVHLCILASTHSCCSCLSVEQLSTWSNWGHIVLLEWTSLYQQHACQC